MWQMLTISPVPPVGSVHFWLRLFLLLLGLCGLYSIITIAVRGWKRRSDPSWQWRRSALRTHALVRRPTARGVAGNILFLLLGWGLHTAYISYQQANNTHTLHDVRVLEKVNDYRYRLVFLDRPSDDFKAVWCSPHPQFARDMVFRYFTYQDKDACWEMRWSDTTKLGFRMYPGYYPNYKENYVGAGEAASEPGTETTAQAR